MMKRDTTVIVCMVATVAMATALVVWFTRPTKKQKLITHPRKYIGGGAVAMETPKEDYKRKQRSVSFVDPIVTREEYTNAIKKPIKARRITRNKNPFIIEPNNGGGDCLFFCFKRAIDDFEVKTSIKELRGIVAEKVTEDQFSVLKAIYDGAKQEGEYNVLGDYNFMEGVETIQDLKHVITNTRKYWGDEMAIRALEEASGITAVIITKGARGKPTVANKMDDHLDIEKKWYSLILLENTHYQTILFQNKAVLDKKELDKALSILKDHILNYI